MNCDTGNGIVDVMVIAFFLVLSCGFGWWLRNFEVRALQWEVNRLRNVEKLCHRLWLQLQERGGQRQLPAPPRRPNLSRTAER
jgi:hypothetical protein